MSESQRNTRGVAIQHRHPITSRGDSETRLGLERRGVVADRAEDLLRLRLQLVFLPRYERHHVVQNVHAADAGVSGARDRLHGHDGDLVHGPEFRLQGGEGDHDSDDGAVGVADEEPFLLSEGRALVGYYVEMGQVDSRDNQGD